MSNRPAWFQFQEDICSYFNSLGANSQTNVNVQGVRTCHDIDVFITTKFLGQNLKWIVEAKKWKSNVNKHCVLGLRTIADDLGVDRAFIISEVGFQKGAFEAAENTNVSLRTFEELKYETRHLIESDIISTFKERLKILELRYWAHSKPIRKKYGLRGDIWDFPVMFSGYQLIQTMLSALKDAEERNYPIDLETFLQEKRGELIAENFQQLTNWLNINFNFLDIKILEAEGKMIENKEFSPQLPPLFSECKSHSELLNEMTSKSF